ncbi:Glucuronosyltransferase [Aphelenchoides besseyi]|nr:Glucuronosyltransferase [Aphelenchoides besseyi]
MIFDSTSKLLLFADQCAKSSIGTPQSLTITNYKKDGTRMLQKPDYLDYLRSRNYSIGMAETFDACAFSLFHLLGIKVTHQLSALPLLLQDQVSYGVPLDITIPVTFDQNQFTPIKSLYERTKNWFMYLSFRWSHLGLLPVDKVMQREISASYPPVKELMKQADFVWLNTNEFIEFPRALPAKIKHIGGVGIGQPQEMNEHFKSIFNRAAKGVILVSFGSIVDTTHMKPRIRDAFLDAFARFPDYEFIWKVSDVNENNLSHLALTRYPNVHPVNWMNQQSILAHHRTSAFITHLGLNSMNEAAFYGVPMVAMPFFVDQQYNTAALLKRKLGVYLNRRQVTAEKLSNAIRTVLEDPSYRKVVKEVSEKINNVPFNSREVFVRNVEFSARHGPVNERQLSTSKTNLIQKHLLDVFAVTIFAFFVVICTVAFTLRWAVRCLLNRFVESFDAQQKKNV